MVYSVDTIKYMVKCSMNYKLVLVLQNEREREFTTGN